MEKLIKTPYMGLFIVALLALGITFLAQLPFFESIKLSAIALGVVVGMLLANSVRPLFPKEWDGGLALASKHFLRTGIVLYGFKLTLNALFVMGAKAVAIDCIIVCSTLLLGNALGRWLKLDKDERLLISSGSAICGAAAVLATEPVLQAPKHKTVVAIATVVLFGTLSMFLYPLLYRMGLFHSFSAEAIGVYTGSTIHEVAHVLGAGTAMTPEITATATITKMIRVMMLAPVLLCLSVIVRSGGSTAKGNGLKNITIPWFAFYFMGVILLNSALMSLSTSGGWNDIYTEFTKIINIIGTFALTMAMTSIGLDATFAKFKQSGLRPFLLAFFLYIWLVLGGILLIRLFY